MSVSDRDLGLLDTAEKHKTAGKWLEAKNLYILVLAETNNPQSKNIAAEGLLEVLERGAVKEFYVRALAWLTFAAGIALAIVLIKFSAPISVPDISLGARDEVSPITLGFASAAALSGGVSCFILIKFAELLEQSSLATVYLMTSRYRGHG